LDERAMVLFLFAVTLLVRVQKKPVPSAMFGFIEGLVGLVDQVLGFACKILAHADKTHAYRNSQGEFRHFEWFLADQDAHSVGSADGALLVGFGHNKAKFLATIPAKNVCSAERRIDTADKGAQQLVTDG